MSRQLEKYLRTRAASTPWRMTGSVRGDYSAAVVIPALAEKQSLPRTLASLATNPAEDLSRTLVLIVVNNRVNTEVELRQNNQQTLNWLRSAPYAELNLAWVDASSDGLELCAKEGVGLARKIGFDLALQCLNWSGRPLLISLDADTLVDGNYLPAIFRHFRASQLAGATIPFRHQAGETWEQEVAIRRYELYLRGYLFGLQRAGSPFAFHTIGSAFACTAQGYVAVGGMNRRQAAEDFYFLQQLAKISGVNMLTGTLVRPSPRFSSRVPFGTGQVVQLQVTQGVEDFKFISAAAFQVLEGWLMLVNSHWQAAGDDVLHLAGELSAELESFLVELDFEANWLKLKKNHLQKDQFTVAFHRWFDGLRTRQLLMRMVNSPESENNLLAELLAWGGRDVASPREFLATLEDLQHGRT